MRKVLMLIISGLFALPVFGSDTVNEQKSTSDTSTNPLTGTQTTTKKYKHKAKTASGAESTANVKETTKLKKDGTVQKSTETDNSDTPVQH